MTAQIIPMHENSLMAAALSYAAIGWEILPCWWAEKNEAGALRCACGNPECKSPAKHPIYKLVTHGQNSSTRDAGLLKDWWERFPQANIAVFLEPSGLCAIDIDPRNGGLQTIEDIEAQHGPLSSDLLQFTGGQGEHRVFLAPKNSTLPGQLGSGVDVKLNGYIMLEPSNHISGGSYAWEASSDPRDGLMASPLPDWLRDLTGQRAGGALAAPGSRVMPITLEQRSEILQAMDAISSDSRDTWLQVGMALQSTGDTQWAFDAWDKWSGQSGKYNPSDQLRVWRSFRGKGLDGITYKTIFGMAKALGVVIKTQAVPVPVASVVVKREVKIEIDESRLRPPGMLGVVTDWVNATARKPQPMFAVQTAIAFASTVLGRRFVTSNRNWSSLYLLNIGKSASGKEHAKWAVETLLEACDMASLIGPASYTSSAGLLSALHEQPSHLTIIDEFGKELEQASIKGNARAQSTMRSLIEVWGRCDGTLRPQGYSTFGVKPSEASKLNDRSVRNPALSLLAMTTPETFFDTIGSAAARDGFLNRFIIVESDIGRQVSTMAQRPEVPQTVIDWAKAMHAASSGVINQVVNPSIQQDGAIVVEISAGAKRLFREFDSECVGLMDKYEVNGLAEMFGRTNEIAMKLALVAAMSRTTTLPMQVEYADAAWAIEYARYHAERTVDRLVHSVHDSEFEAAKQQVIGLLTKHGERGMTVREIDKASRKFTAMNQRQQIELLSSLQFVGSAQLVAIPPSSGRGKPRNAWVATAHDLNDESISADKNTPISLLPAIAAD